MERGVATHLGDVRVEEYLRNTDADVVIATRPKINDYLAAYGTDRYLRIGQEHLTHAMHSDHVRTHQDAAIPLLDAFVTVSYADAANYRAAITGSGTATADGDALITCIPNAVPAVDVEPSDGDSKLIVAAGRLIKVKRYDRLISAFALVSERHPDWRLRLYGRGRQQAALRAKIDELGLYDRAFLMGAHAPIEAEWAKGAIAAVSSDAESFGMTLVEAMHCGVPVVSTDCPYGPGEIISNGQDGLLSPLGPTEKASVRAYADALIQLIEQPRTAVPDEPGRAGEGRPLLPRAHRRRVRAADREAADAAQRSGQTPPVAVRARDDEAALRSRTARPRSRGRPEPQPLRSHPRPRRSRAAGATAAGKASAADASRRPGRAGKASTAKAHAPAAPARAAAFAMLTLGPVLRPALQDVAAATATRTVPPRSCGRPLARTRVATDGSLVIRLLAKRLPKTARCCSYDPAATAEHRIASRSRRAPRRWRAGSRYGWNGRAQPGRGPLGHVRGTCRRRQAQADPLRTRRDRPAAVDARRPWTARARSSPGSRTPPSTAISPYAPGIAPGTPKSLPWSSGRRAAPYGQSCTGRPHRR